MTEPTRTLGIVGHAAEKFTAKTEAGAKRAMLAVYEACMPSAIVSGHSPMGGVDLYAEALAEHVGCEMIVHAPKVHRWDGAGGFKERNLAIARDSGLVLCVVVREPPPGYQGMRFGSCYHCRGRVPYHVKSGGCWTAWKTPAQRWALIEPDGSWQIVEAEA